MRLRAIIALVRTDLQLFRGDRRAVVVGVLVPILIAAFFGYVFGGSGARDDAGKMAVAVVNEDAVPLAAEIVAALAADPLLNTRSTSRAEAETLVRTGQVPVAVRLPAHFSDAAVGAFFTGRGKPRVELLVDPSNRMSGQVVEGLLTEHAMQLVSKAAMSGPDTDAQIAQRIAELAASSDAEVSQRAELKSLLESVQRLNARTRADGGPPAGGIQRGLTIPYEVDVRPLSGPANVPYNSYAHSFAGMTVQFILVSGIDAGVVLLLMRSRGIWQRFRSAPLARWQLLVARALSTTLIGLFQFVLVYAAAFAIFHVRIQGSVLGFAAVALSFCVMNATFGLMLASIGRSAGVTRGLATMATLLLVMVGGAWVPSFVFPAWLQTVSLASPVRWAVDGLDAMTWRGLGLDAALMPVAVLLVTAMACLAISLWRFRWEE